MYQDIQYVTILIHCTPEEVSASVNLEEHFVEVPSVASTARQYALAERARQLGWTKEQVILVDEDLGLSGASVDRRTGFARLTTEVTLGRVGIVLGLEVSRLARNNADWYRLLDLCGPDRHFDRRWGIVNLSENRG